MKDYDVTVRVVVERVYSVEADSEADAKAHYVSDGEVIVEADYGTEEVVSVCVASGGEG